MSADLIVSDPHSPDAAGVARAAAALAAGRLIVLPTETVYGLACRADDEAALARLVQVKRRAPEKALALLLPAADRLAAVAEVSAPAERLAAAFMPGPITLVLRKLPSVSPLVSRGRDTVGVRVPDLPLTLAILRACDFPVVATSANLAGEAPATSVSALADELRDAVDVIVDAGPCPGGEASTVVDVTVAPPVILRPGPVTEQALREALARRP